MKTELIKIFDDNKNEIGVASREEVHKYGYWHEVCHCWFVSSESDVDYIYLQRRSEMKKENPGLLDITAAGHLLADENVDDSVREIKEELGIDVDFDELLPLGVIDYFVTIDQYIDKEISNVFLYKKVGPFEDFILQKEEVAGMMKANFNDFAQLWHGEKDQIDIQGYEINQHGEKIVIHTKAGRADFVQHPLSYYNQIIQGIKKYI